MDYCLTQKIKIGISACNFGSQVRYNHRGWDRVGGLGREQHDYLWTPVCPEVLSGLGVPRLPVRLVGGNGDDFWQGTARMKNRSGREVSELVRAGARCAREVLARVDVDAFAFMEGSPTCGVYRTTLKEKRLGKPPGVFGSLLLKEDVFLFPAGDMESPWKWWDYSRRLHAFVWLKRAEISSKKQLYEAWHALKFLCQEADERQAREIGTAIAKAPRVLTKAYLEEWRCCVLRLLRRPSTLNRIAAVMVKHYAHYRKHFGLNSESIRAPRSEQGKREFVEQLKIMERKAFTEGYQFGGHPVVYRPLR